MIAGPHILSPIFLATTEQWRAKPAAYISGAAISISLVVVVAYLLGDSLGSRGRSRWSYRRLRLQYSSHNRSQTRRNLRQNVAHSSDSPADPLVRD